MKQFKWFCFMALVAVWTSCGSAKKTVVEDPGLKALLGDKDYAMLSASDKYEIAEYFTRRGNMERARAVYEDIITQNPGVIGIKYKLAQLYLQMDTVTFPVKNDKGHVEWVVKSGKELGESVIEEIQQQDPTFLPVYSDLMIINMERQDTGKVRQIYQTARQMDQGFNQGDYRVGYLTIFDLTNANRFQEGQTTVRKAKKMFYELYDAYKQLGNIQKVQGMDTLAYASYKKAFKIRTESADLFDAYYEMADVCYELYRKRNVEKYKEEALEYACQSLQFFPGYQPSVALLKSLAGLGTNENGKGIDTTALKAVEEYCRGIKATGKTTGALEQSVIPKSLFGSMIAESMQNDSEEKSSGNYTK